MNTRMKLLAWTDRLTGWTLVALITGTAAAFGGRVWWAPTFIGVLCGLLVLLGSLRVILVGSLEVFKSPVTFVAVLTLGLGVAQLLPLPGRISSLLSPGSQGVYSMGMVPGQARDLAAGVELSDPVVVKAPLSIDRPATLRWVGGAAACLAMFWAAAHFADRLDRLYVIWGAVVAGFFLNTAVASVQLICGSKASGLLGFVEPGQGSIWAPTLDDLAAGPNSSVLRQAGQAVAGHPVWAAAIPDRPFLLGTQMGGVGAYLALASLGLPLALALTFQILAPRGSRETMGARLAHNGQGGLLTLVYGLLLLSAALVGLVAGPFYAAVLGLGLVLVGLPSAWPAGLRWSGICLTFLPLLLLGAGAGAGALWASSKTFPPPVAAEAVGTALRVWRDSAPIAKDFPLVGTGLGTFASIYPFYKTQDATATTAMSSLLQWWVESGLVGIGLLGLVAFWCLVRLPGAIRRVGGADRSLAFGLIGAAVGFTLFAAVHWAVELTSVALAASAVAGLLDRWLAGGTDLFVERV